MTTLFTASWKRGRHYSNGPIQNFPSVGLQAPASVLDQVISLPITEWNFKTDARTKHIGPMAQDFYAAFGLGTDDKHIATVDADGVALAAIQGLNQKVESENAALRAENAELKRRLEKIEELLSHGLSAGLKSKRVSLDVTCLLDA